MKKLNKKHFSEIPLDNYEKELKEFLDRGEFVSDPDFKKNKKKWIEMVKRHLELLETKSITLRINKGDLIRVKAKARRNNMPYQTLIKTLIAQYAKGKTRLII